MVDIQVQLAIVAAFSAVSIAAINFGVAYLTRRELKSYRHQVNSRLDELLAVTKREAHASGMEDERTGRGKINNGDDDDDDVNGKVINYNRIHE